VVGNLYVHKEYTLLGRGFAIRREEEGGGGKRRKRWKAREGERDRMIGGRRNG